MDFLDYIDKQHTENRLQYKEDEVSKTFSTFLPVQANDFRSSCGYLIKKQDKAKLILLCGKQRVYFSDVDIIKTIISLPSEIANWFLKQFIKVYQNKYTEFSFEINNTSFVGYGIPKYPNQKNILLISDSEITINEFIFIINFILFKDLKWKEKSKIEDFDKRTLCKYISLIDYFVNNSEKSKSFLTNIGYPIPDEPSLIWENKKIKKLFSLTKSFDISNYI